MTLPFAIPDWMPGWLFLALAIPALLWILAFLMVPFNVFGVKARLETLESELEELNEQIRIMQLRASGPRPSATPMRSAENYDDLPLRASGPRPSATPMRSAENYDDLPNFAQLKRTQPMAPPPPVEEPPPPPKRPLIPTPQPRASFGAREALAPRERPTTPPRPRRTEPRLD